MVLHGNACQFPVQIQFFCGKLFCQRSPDIARASVQRKTEPGIWSPRNIVFLENKILQDRFQVCGCNSVPDPRPIQFFRRICPDFVIVGHEKPFGYTGTETREYPFPEISRFPVLTIFLNINNALETFPENFFGKVTDIVLKRIRNKTILHSDPCLAPMENPALFFSQKAVHHLIEIGIMTEQDMPAQVPAEAVLVVKGRGQTAPSVFFFTKNPVCMPHFRKTPCCTETAGTAAKNCYSHVCVEVRG